MTLKEIKDKAITIALAQTNGNRIEAAKLLGITIDVMYNEISRRCKKDR